MLYRHRYSAFTATVFLHLGFVLWTQSIYFFLLAELLCSSTCLETENVLDKVRQSGMKHRQSVNKARLVPQMGANLEKGRDMHLQTERMG